MVWDAHGAAGGVHLLLNDDAGHLEFKETVYSHFMGLACDEEGEGPVEVIYRPDGYKPPGPTPMIMQPHIPNVGTGAYDDVKKCLGNIYHELVELKKMKLVYVFGDQQVRGLKLLPGFYVGQGKFGSIVKSSLILLLQSYSRMVWLKRMRPELYSWLIPMPGEFHFKVRLSTHDSRPYDCTCASLEDRTSSQRKFNKSRRYRL